ncbi:hypothetical protein ZWY2020_053306, partial [Hordeum vulgare]
MIYKPSPTSERFMFEHDESLRADLLPINFPASYENGKLEDFLHRWMKNHEHKNFWFSMFPERRYFFSIREKQQLEYEYTRWTLENVPYNQNP